MYTHIILKRTRFKHYVDKHMQLHNVETRMLNTIPKHACVALCSTAFCHLEETIVALLLRHDPHGRRLPYS